jgi:hypothetical protein
MYRAGHDTRHHATLGEQGPSRPKKHWIGEEPGAVVMRSRAEGFRRLSPPPRVTETVPALGEEWSSGATFDARAV